MNKIAVYLPDSLVTHIQDIANANCQPLSVFLRTLILDYVRNHQKNNAAATKRDEWVVRSNKL